MPRIQLKLAALLVGLVVAVVLLSGTLAERSLRHRELREVEQSLRTRAALAAGWLAATGDTGSLDARVDRAGEAADARVTLIGPDGRVLGDSEVPAASLPDVDNHADRPEVAEALAGRVGVSTRRSRTVVRSLLYLAIPHRIDGEPAAVRLAVDISEIDAAVWALRRTLWTAGALGILASLALSVLLSRSLLRPLEEMRRTVNAIADGDLGVRLRLGGGDEFAEIARAVNHMAAQIRQRLLEASEEKERLQAVLSGMVEGVLVLDVQGRVVLANPRLRQMFSFWAPIEGRAPLELIRHPAVEESLALAAESREPVVREVELGGAEERVVLLHAVGFGQGERRFGTVAVFHDVTELRRLEAVRREFVAAVSHELKTPLTAIRGFAETLQDGDVPPETAKSYLGVILKQMRRLESLIEDVLELSRIESRRMPIEPAETDLLRIAKGVVTSMEPQIRARDLTVRIHCEHDPRAWADPRAVEQVLMNLVDNAAKYTDPGGRIDVRIISDGDRTRIRVQDTGIGIPPGDLGRVFERFYRVDKARSRDLGGTGLGLAIVKHLVGAMDGDIAVESQLDRGTTFTVTLPAADAEGASA